MPDDAWRQHGGAASVASGQRGGAKRAELVLFSVAMLLAVTRGGIVAGDEGLRRPATTRLATQRVVKHPAADVVRAFREHLKADRVAEARGLLAASAAPVRDADRRLKRLAAALSAGGWDFSILDAKDDGGDGGGGDVAVVLVNDYLKDGRKTIDIKPWYLVRQGGEWRLLAKFTDFELKEYGFDSGVIERFRALEVWAEGREPQLRKELPDCGC